MPVTRNRSAAPRRARPPPRRARACRRPGSVTASPGTSQRPVRRRARASTPLRSAFAASAATAAAAPRVERAHQRAAAQHRHARAPRAPGRAAPPSAGSARSRARRGPSRSPCGGSRSWCRSRPARARAPPRAARPRLRAGASASAAAQPTTPAPTTATSASKLTAQGSQVPVAAIDTACGRTNRPHRRRVVSLARPSRTDAEELRAMEEAPGRRPRPRRARDPAEHPAAGRAGSSRELGYRQELSRAWSGFTNFAISFTIISVLAGTFTTFAFAWQNGGPIAASIGWPVLCVLRADGGLLDGRADVEVPDGRRPLLVGARPRRQGLELDDRLVQHRRPGRDRRLGGLRRGDLPQRHARRSTASTSSASTSATRAHPRRDVAAVLPDPRPLHRREHLRRPASWR